MMVYNEVMDEIRYDLFRNSQLHSWVIMVYNVAIYDIQWKLLIYTWLFTSKERQLKIYNNYVFLLCSYWSIELWMFTMKLYERLNFIFSVQTDDLYIYKIRLDISNNYVGIFPYWKK